MDNTNNDPNAKSHEERQRRLKRAALLLAMGALRASQQQAVAVAVGERAEAEKGEAAR
jgi:hypothetical protein